MRAGSMLGLDTKSSASKVTISRPSISELVKTRGRPGYQRAGKSLCHLKGEDLRSEKTSIWYNPAQQQARARAWDTDEPMGTSPRPFHPHGVLCSLHTQQNPNAWIRWSLMPQCFEMRCAWIKLWWRNVTSFPLRGSLGDVVEERCGPCRRLTRDCMLWGAPGQPPGFHTGIISLALAPFLPVVFLLCIQDVHDHTGPCPPQLWILTCQLRVHSTPWQW